MLGNPVSIGGIGLVAPSVAAQPPAAIPMYPAPGGAPVRAGVAGEEERLPIVLATPDDIAELQDKAKLQQIDDFIKDVPAGKST